MIDNRWMLVEAPRLDRDLDRQRRWASKPRALA
jgi:hypothetical protein